MFPAFSIQCVNVYSIVCIHVHVYNMYIYTYAYIYIYWQRFWQCKTLRSDRTWRVTVSFQRCSASWWSATEGPIGQWATVSLFSSWCTNFGHGTADDGSRVAKKKTTLYFRFIMNSLWFIYHTEEGIDPPSIQSFFKIDIRISWFPWRSCFATPRGCMFRSGAEKRYGKKNCSCCGGVWQLNMNWKNWRFWYVLITFQH